MVHVHCNNDDTEDSATWYKVQSTVRVYRTYEYICIHILSAYFTLPWFWIACSYFLHWNSPFSYIIKYPCQAKSRLRDSKAQLCLNHYAFIIFLFPNFLGPKRLRWQAYKVGHAWALLHAPSRLAMHQWRPKGRSPSPHQPSLSAPVVQQKARCGTKRKTKNDWCDVPL